MNKALSFVVGGTLTALASPAAQAQTARADSSLVATASLALTRRYTAAVGEAARLYNGPEYVSYVPRNTQGQPFFGTDAPQPASVTYDGYTYSNVPLRFDLVRNQLVLRGPGGGIELALLNERVSGFELAGNRFVRLTPAADQPLPAGPGYYDVLVDGPVRLLGVHRKSLQSRSSFTGVTYEVTARDEYFVEREHRYYPVSKASAVWRLFPDQKAALRRYVSDNHLKFKARTREAALVALLRYRAALPPPAPH